MAAEFCTHCNLLTLMNHGSVNERVSIVDARVNKWNSHCFSHVISSAAWMRRCARKWKWAVLQTLETWCLKDRLLSRVAPRVTIRSERGMIDLAMATPGTGRKLRMRLDVPSRIDSDLLPFKASPLWQSQECSECRQDSRALSWTVRSSVDTEMCNWLIDWLIFIDQIPCAQSLNTITWVSSLYLLQGNPVVRRNTTNGWTVDREKNWPEDGTLGHSTKTIFKNKLMTTGRRGHTANGRWCMNRSRRRQFRRYQSYCTVGPVTRCDQQC